MKQFQPFLPHHAGLLDSQLSKGFGSGGGGNLSFYQPAQINMPDWYGAAVGNTFSNTFGGMGGLGELAKQIGGQQQARPAFEWPEDVPLPDGYSPQLHHIYSMQPPRRG